MTTMNRMVAPKSVFTTFGFRARPLIAPTIAAADATPHFYAVYRVSETPPDSAAFAGALHAALLRWAERGADALGEAGQDGGIEPVGLGELAGGAGKVTDLPRIGEHHGQADGGERRDDGALDVAAFAAVDGALQAPVLRLFLAAALRCCAEVVDRRESP